MVGAAGLSARWGLTELDDGEAEIQRLAIERSSRLVVIADGSKIGSATNAVVTEAERIGTLVTDRRGARAASWPPSAALGVEIVMAGAQDAAPAVPGNGAGPG